MTANAQLLSANEDLFGRVALYNKLVTPEQLAECTRAIFVDAVADQPRRTLEEIMVAQSYLSPEVARSIAEAVRKKLAASRPAPAAAPPRSNRARAGDSQVMVKVEAGGGPGRKRIWVDAPAGEDKASVRVSCSHLYPSDGQALSRACRQLLELKHRNLEVDMRGVEHVPSVILAEIAKFGVDSWERGRRVNLLAEPKVAAIAEMVVGKIVTVVRS
jgi:hypothetical protein